MDVILLLVFCISLLFLSNNFSYLAAYISQHSGYFSLFSIFQNVSRTVFRKDVIIHCRRNVWVGITWCSFKIDIAIDISWLAIMFQKLCIVMTHAILFIRVLLIDIPLLIQLQYNMSYALVHYMWIYNCSIIIVSSSVDILYLTCTCICYMYVCMLYLLYYYCTCILYVNFAES